MWSALVKVDQAPFGVFARHLPWEHSEGRNSRILSFGVHLAYRNKGRVTGIFCKALVSSCEEQYVHSSTNPSVLHDNFIYCLTAFAFIKVVHRGVVPQFSSVTKLSTSSPAMGGKNRCLRLFSYTVCFYCLHMSALVNRGKSTLKVQAREYCHSLGSFKTLKVPEEFHKEYTLCNGFHETVLHSHPSRLNQFYVETSLQNTLCLWKRHIHAD